MIVQLLSFMPVGPTSTESPGTLFFRTTTLFFSHQNADTSGVYSPQNENCHFYTHDVTPHRLQLCQFVKWGPRFLFLRRLPWVYIRNPFYGPQHFFSHQNADTTMISTLMTWKHSRFQHIAQLCEKQSIVLLYSSVVRFAHVCDRFAHMLTVASLPRIVVNL